MGIGPQQFARIEPLLVTGTRVLTVGRLLFRTRYRRHYRDSADECYFDEYVARHHSDVTVESADASEYQGATVLQDMNLPLAERNFPHRGRYDVLIDGGSLEHFFNVPQALQNYHDLLGTNGVIYIMTNANNHFGHGFYQFSSELFYRVFSAENGYQIIECFLEKHPYLAAEVSSRRRVYTAPDPGDRGRRTQFTSCSPVLIHAIARKLQDGPLAPSIIQSDYQAIWQNEPSLETDSATRRFVIRLFDTVPFLWKIYDLFVREFPRRLSVNPDFRRKTQKQRQSPTS